MKSMIGAQLFLYKLGREPGRKSSPVPVVHVVAKARSIDDRQLPASGQHCSWFLSKGEIILALMLKPLSSKSAFRISTSVVLSSCLANLYH